MAIDGDDPDDADWIDFGPPRDPDRQRRLSLRVLLTTAAVIVTVVTVVTVATHEPNTPSLPPPTAASSPARDDRSSAPGTPPSSPVVPPAGPVLVSDAKRPLLPGAGDWDLFVRADLVLFRVQLRSGRITKTAVPAVHSSGAVSFLAGPKEVIIVPYDNVEGALLPDDQPARRLPGILDGADRVLPGPDGQLWVREDDANSEAPWILVDFDGKVAKKPASILVSEWAYSDAAGYLLVSDLGGVYEARPSGLRRISRGAIAAVGPTHYLISDCDDRHHCTLFDYDRADGSLRAVPGVADAFDSLSGSVSPDGRFATLMSFAEDGQPRLRLINLSTGTVRRLQMDPAQSYTLADAGKVVWSPDSRWLFTLLGGALVISDTTTGKTRSLNLPDRGLNQVAIRVNQS